MTDQAKSTFTPSLIPDQPCEAFREAFLLQCDRLSHRQTLRRFGDLLGDLVREAELVTGPRSAAEADREPDPLIVVQMRGVLVDLWAIDATLLDAAGAYQEGGLGPQEAALSLLAEQLQREVSEVAAKISDALEGE